MQKSILERGAPPTFDVAVEMLERGRWLVHVDVGTAVDALLAGNNAGGQVSPQRGGREGGSGKPTRGNGGVAAPPLDVATLCLLLEEVLRPATA